ncbi:Asp-tRNA(Asn)/Glu-tRNA(Gln) amidotransferase subunit GatC [Candidatus Woesearchaeota archaeon]|nr:Asp-tRNA(Asn)/Glu-tRNA(Gln) amidotransferase subunit GatC [Candidatus Woesearchaeota archaeon]
MEITKELIKRVADNARLRLRDDEIEKLQNELKEILEHFSKLDKLDTSKAKPSFHPIEIKNVMRDDVAKKPLIYDEVFGNTKNRKENYFKGPRAL